VYAVEFSHRSGRDLINVAKKRTNIIPIIEDARHPHNDRMLIGMVDTIFADVAQPDQARIVSINAQYFLKNEGHFVISIKVSYTLLFINLKCFDVCVVIKYLLINFYNYRQTVSIVQQNQQLYLLKK